MEMEMELDKVLSREQILGNANLQRPNESWVTDRARVSGYENIPIGWRGY